MDRILSQKNGESGRATLPSRQAALDACREGLADASGPVLLTGEAGVGKTWLWRKLAAAAPDARLWAAVDVSPLADPAGFHCAIGAGLGLTGGASARDVAEFLEENSEDGRRYALVVDEARNASAEILEEIRLLSNRIDRADGFAAILLVGQTGLLKRIETRPLAALEARLARKVHLLPVDADEAIELLSTRFPHRTWNRAEADHLHRAASGNPRKLLRLASASSGPGRIGTGRPVRPAHPRPTVEPATPRATHAASDESPAAPTPRLGADKPPIFVEEGLIEVGWQPEDEAGEPSVSTAVANHANGKAEPLSSEVIEDHYAALQAWNEWARNQGRQAADADLGTESAAVQDWTDYAPVSHDLEAEDEPSLFPDNVRIEPREDFAPYGQLFTRLRQMNDQD